MRIELLRKREAFEEVFADSLGKFLKDYSNWSGNIYWSNRSAFGFRSNDYLNVIYHHDLPRTTLKDITREFSWHPRFVRRLLQTAYVWAAVRKPAEIMLNRRGLIIDPCPEFVRDWVFIPGNHSIRVVDTKTQTCRVFTKSGYDPEFLRAEISIRVEYPFLGSPLVINADPEYPWYEEERVTGMPLNRLGTSRDYRRGIEGAQARLSRLYSLTRREEPSAKYVGFLCDQIEVALEAIKKKWGSDLVSSARSIRDSLRKSLCEYSDCNVLTVRSHGDFQPANILVGVSHVSIIDWEYSKRRSQFYDALTFELQARSYLGLAVRYLSFMEKLRQSDQLAWTGKSLDECVGCYLPLFLLEDMALKLEEIIAPAITGQPHEFMGWLIEIAKVLPHEDSRMDSTINAKSCG